MYGATSSSSRQRYDEDVQRHDRQKSVSYFIVAMAVLIGDMARGVLFPTLWKNVLRFGGSKQIQGIAVASFSAGRVVSSPFFGTISEQYGHRWILALCAAIIAAGCMQYCYATSLSSIIVGQFITGAGAGSLGVTRSYVVQCATEKKQRTVYLAHLNAIQYMGFSVMPISGSLMAQIGEKYPFRIPFLQLTANEFTLPALFMVVISLLNMVLFLVFFEEPLGRHSRSTSVVRMLRTVDSYSLLKFVNEPAPTATIAGTMARDDKDGTQMSTTKGLLSSGTAQELATTEFESESSNLDEEAWFNESTAEDPSVRAPAPALTPGPVPGSTSASTPVSVPAPAPAPVPVPVLCTHAADNRWTLPTWWRFDRLSDGDKVTLVGCLLTVTTKGTIGVFETLGAEFSLSHFQWDSIRTGAFDHLTTTTIVS